MSHVTMHTAAHTTSFLDNAATTSGRQSASASPALAHDGMAKAAVVHLGFAIAALVCLLMSRPGLASDSIVGSGSMAGVSSLRVQANGGEGIRVPTAAFALASADIDGFRRQAAFVSAPMGTEAISQSRGVEMDAQVRREVVADVQRNLSSASTVAEPATIAVLGFTVAALLAVRRRKNAAAAAVVE